MDIYRSVGYTDRDAVQSIVQNNLYGLDIDDRAAQLAYFAVMMKACDYDRRFLRRGVQPHICVIAESSPVDDHLLNAFGAEKPLAQRLLGTFANAKEYGSILHVDFTPEELARLRRRLDDMKHAAQTSLTSMADNASAVAAIEPLLQPADILAGKYDAVVTNPPYMGSSGMNEKLSAFVKEHYPDSKSDLFAVFIERGMEWVKENGYSAMVTMQSWMFLSSFEKLRKAIISQKSIAALMHMENMVMGIAFGTAVTVIRNAVIKGYKGTYNHIKYEDIVEAKPKEFPVTGNRFAQVATENFTKIPGCPVAYWVGEKMLSAFSQQPMTALGFSGIGMRTGDNERFLRRWYEVSCENMLLACKNKEEQIETNKRWIPYNKGGEFRKWYGNNEYVVNWWNDGEEIKENTKKTYPYLGDNLGWKISNESYYYKPGITWSGVTSGAFGCRCYDEGFIFDSGANGLFAYREDDRFYLAGLLNTSLIDFILSIINPTINTGSGTIGKIPTILSEKFKQSVSQTVEGNIGISKEDWDSFETSWDFKKHPLI